MMPTVSVITPCYNCARFVGRTIASVRQQTRQEWELIVVDDGSTDHSAEVAAAAAGADPRVRLIRQPNGGVCKARNTGFAHASRETPYLLFLDADDCLEPEMLAVLTGYLEEHPDVGVAYCDYVFVDADDRAIDTLHLPRYAPGRVLVRRLPDDAPDTPFASILCGAPAMASLSVMRRCVYERTPGWDELFGQHFEDTDMMLHMALHAQVHYVPRVLYRYRRHDQQSTAHCERFAAQEQKLLAKWQEARGLSPEHARVARSALRFRRGRFVPYMAFQWGNEHLRRRMLGKATRFYLGGLRRWVASL